jgi:hypothetical protein
MHGLLVNSRTVRPRLGNIADRNDRRARLLAGRRAFEAGPPKEEGPRGRVELLIVDLKGCAHA